MNRSKIRGQQRKLNKLLEYTEKIKAYEHTDISCESFSVPSSPFIQSQKTAGRIKTQFAEAWLLKAQEVLLQKPKNLPFCKVVAILDEPDFWNSKIIVFYDETYYNTFWKRDGAGQKWCIIRENGKSFLKQRNVTVNLPEISISELIDDGGTVKKSTLWVYGEFPDKLTD